MNEIETLYNKYYSSNQKTDVTSSHWAEIGEIPKLINGTVDIKGIGGFGDFVPLTLKNSLRNFIYPFLIQSYISKYSENKKTIKASKDIARESERLFLMDCAKHIMPIEIILKSFNISDLSEKNINKVCIIGDGYGYLGNLLKRLFPNLTIIYVNLGKQLLFDFQITEKVHPSKIKKMITKKNENLDQHDFYFLEAEQFNLLEGLNIDLFFNIASMQEMDKRIVDEYFRLMRSSISDKKYFFCCNRELKILPDGERVAFDEYHWNDSKTIFEDTPGWYQSYPCQRPPFWKPFDGTFKLKFIEF